MQKQTFLSKHGQKVAILGAVVGASAPAMAVEIDASAITTAINGIVPVITSTGMALLSVYVVIKAFGLVTGFLARGR
ncbi:major capsid protein [Neisseria iguanae]|uniref:Phage coat protein n=1 Tax=Neisseria iguanae TaxID=90242 RepID=A0A2P7TYK3_9NEIS|nr:major capsid protein [Neisseria iguanae]PSJ79798.1 hypothetical protein C7N83_09975 [Neisseria iguanae]